MKRTLLAGVVLCLLLHWQQAWERCRQADRRAQSAREELQSFEDALKEWPQLRRQARRLAPTLKPSQITHAKSLQVSFTADKLDDQPVYRMRLKGPRLQVVHELESLAQSFCLTQLDLRTRPDGQVQGEALLQAVR